MRHAVIMAGGAGKRLWPLSRAARPKQLLPLLSDQSLLRDTWERVAPLGKRERAWVVTAADLKAACRRELPELPAARVLGEPVGRNTAPAMALAAALARREDRRALLAVFPSDHHIADTAGFRALCRRALRCAREEEALVTLGVPPTSPETGYGYIETAGPPAAGDDRPLTVKRFVEKPDLATARRFLRGGRHLWNGGIFFLPIGALIEAFIAHAPEIWAAAEAIAAHYGQPGFSRALKREYGRDIAFFGGVNTQRLPFATPEEVREEVRQCIEVLGRGGGYICGPDHHIKPDVPASNTVALFEAARGGG